MANTTTNDDGHRAAPVVWQIDTTRFREADLRKMIALQLAIQHHSQGVDAEVVVHTAGQFERYLK
ncbi:hypothetical protein ACWEN6_14055 [Sphaerisporangium sp. NPDC004334]